MYKALAVLRVYSRIQTFYPLSREIYAERRAICHVKIFFFTIEAFVYQKLIILIQCGKLHRSKSLTCAPKPKFYSSFLTNASKILKLWNPVRDHEATCKTIQGLIVCDD